MADDTDVSQKGGGGTRPPDGTNVESEEVLVNSDQSQEGTNEENLYREQFITVKSRRNKRNAARGAGQAEAGRGGQGNLSRGGGRGGNKNGGMQNDRPSLRGSRGGTFWSGQYRVRY